MRYYAISLLLIFLSACKTEYKSPAVKNSFESVMKVHDDIMPEMSTINKLSRKLKKLENPDSQVEELLSKLEAADDGMMDWMQAFKFDKKAAVNLQLEYLSKEQKKIDKVSIDMQTAITTAQEYLNNKGQ